MGRYGRETPTNRPKWLHTFVDHPHRRPNRHSDSEDFQRAQQLKWSQYYEISAASSNVLDSMATSSSARSTSLEPRGSGAGCELNVNRNSSRGNRFEIKAATCASISESIGEVPTSRQLSEWRILSPITWVKSGTWDASMRTPRVDNTEQCRAKGKRHLSVGRGR
ncbi:hypothetical protein B0H19DRAFT_1076377 [Mycena capillaripes]|nr:hypothetical protein B0H19DRAFT_1076377 [Mycena capillaripes]